MVNKEVITFIKQEFSKGRPKEGIKMDLLNSDYSLREIEEAFKSLKQQPVKTTDKKRDNLVITFFLIFILVLSISIFLNFKYAADVKNCQSQQVDLTIKYVDLKLLPTDLCKQLRTTLMIIRFNIIITAITSAYLGFLLIKSK